MEGVFKMTEKLTFAAICGVVKNLKEGEELWFINLKGVKYKFITFYKEVMVTSDSLDKGVSEWMYYEIDDWKIIRPEKKKVKLYQAVFKGRSGFFILDDLYKNEEEAKEGLSDYGAEVSFIKLIEPAICEIEEE